MTTTQTDEIKTWQQRLEETCPALGPMHIHACVEEVNDAMQAEIAELRSALQEQAREGETAAPGLNRLLTELSTFAEANPGTYIFPRWDGSRVMKHLRKAPQPAQPSEPAQPEQGPST